MAVVSPGRFTVRNIQRTIGRINHRENYLINTPYSCMIPDILTWPRWLLPDSCHPASQNAPSPPLGERAGVRGKPSPFPHVRRAELRRYRCVQEGWGVRASRLLTALLRFLKHLYRNSDALPSRSVYRLRLLWRALHAYQKISIADSAPRSPVARAGDFARPNGAFDSEIEL